MALILIFVLIFLLCYFIKTKYKLYVIGSELIGPWSIPPVGSVGILRKLKPEYFFINFTENRRYYDETFRFWLGTQLWVFLHTPAETRDALNDTSLVRADTFQQLKVLIGNGLLVSEGKYWQAHRRILVPAFQAKILNSFSYAITEHANIFVQKVQNLLVTSAQPIEVGELLFPCILDIIIDTSMGKKLDAQCDPTGTYAKAFHTINVLLFKRMINPILSFDFIFKRTKLYRRLNEAVHTIHNLMDEIIEGRLIFLSSRGNSYTKGQKHVFLDTLLTAQINGHQLTISEIRDEVNTFVLAGVETTWSAMCFILYALSKYPEEQSKVFEEMFNTCAYDAPLIEDLTKMPYLEMFIKECLRLYTIVPLTGRQTTKDTKIGDRHYCAGITIWINMYGLAHDVEYFAEPYEFRPERFRAENLKEIHTFSYLPFSGGPHVCIGRKYAMLIMKMLMVRIIQTFTLKLQQPHKELVLVAEMVLKSLHGIEIVFEKRNQS